MSKTHPAAPDRLRGLSFAEPLESEFRGQHAISASRFAGPVVLLGVLLVGFWALLDLKLSLGGFAQPGIWVKLGIIVPALLVLLVTHLTEPAGRTVLRLSLVSAAGVTTGFAVLLFATPIDSLGSVFLSLNVVTVYIYLLSGQRLLTALVLAVPLAVAAQWVAARAGVPAGEAAVNGIFLAVTNALCAIAAYRFEHIARSTFLEREVTAILNGNDPATGIPNRASLERRYQLIVRQGAREGRSIALLIGAVDGFDHHAGAVGARVASGDLRRIAHAVLQSVGRPLDLAARIEDARFGILLYDVNAESLPSVMRQIRQNVALLDIEHNAEHGPSVLSLSIGAVLAAPGARRDLATLMTVAELALDEARDPANHGIAVRSIAQEQEGEAVTTGPWHGLRERSGT